MKQRQQSARLAKLQAGRRAQQLPKPAPEGADESFRKLEQAIQYSKAVRERHERQASRLTYELAIIAFCFGIAAAIFGIYRILN